MMDPSLSSNKLVTAREQFRVAEALYWKDNELLLAARMVVPIICEMQAGFLLSGKNGKLCDVSLAGLATRTNCAPGVLARCLRRLAVESPAGVVRIDDLVGPVGHYPRGVAVGYVDPKQLVPTDDATDPEAYEAFCEVFREGRQRIFDPVLVVEGVEMPPKGYVVNGHHRSAAAFATRKLVRVAILRTKQDLLKHLQEGGAEELVRRCSTFSEFVARCAERARRLEMHERGWLAWLDSLLLTRATRRLRGQP